MVSFVQPWLQHYPACVPEHINPDSYPSLTALFEEALERYADRVAFKNFGVALSYAQLDRLSQQVATFFREEWQLKPGTRIALMLPNVLSYPVLLLAALRADLIIVNVNPLYTAQELHHLLKDSQASAIVVLDHFAHVVERVLERLPHLQVGICRVGDLLGWKGMLINGVVKYLQKKIPAYTIPQAVSFKKMLKTQVLKAVKHQRGGHDIALLQYTGGTTGISKGAALSHRNLIANVLQAKAWLKPLEKEQLEGGILTALPLYHIFSFTANCLTFLSLGYTNILVTNPRDIKDLIKTFEKEKPMAMTGVNTLFHALNQAPAFQALDFSRFRIALGGGMAVQTVVAERWEAITGKPLLEAYGLTEASPAVCINPLDAPVRGSVGVPISSTEIKIIDPQGKSLPSGEVGELCVRGPQIMVGYWERPEETAAVLSEDGWLKTGDLAKMDESGFVYIVDRIKDMILISGFNVYPNEVEDVIASMPEVKEVAVIGVPHSTTGEQVVAFIVPAHDQVNPNDVIRYARQSLTSYKIPKKIIFQEALPKSNVGKVLRKELRQLWQALKQEGTA